MVSLKVERESTENSSTSGHTSTRDTQVESKLQNLPSPFSFEENMSILRFKSVIKRKDSQLWVDISNCGFEVTVQKLKQKV